MAGRIKEYTGIDPFTINQVILTERYTQEKENPFFSLVDTLKQTSVFVEGDSLFRGLQGDRRYDVRLFHPRSTYTSGRPSWLLMGGQRHAYLLNTKDITIDYPVLVKAYLLGEPEDAIPIDIVEIESRSDQKALILPVGKYVIKLNNIKGDYEQMNVRIGHSP